MSWLTPDVIDILLGIIKAVVILLVVVTCVTTNTLCSVRCVLLRRR